MTVRRMQLLSKRLVLTVRFQQSQPGKGASHHPHALNLQPHPHPFSNLTLVISKVRVGKGPQSSSTAPSPCSQSPAPSTLVTHSHSCRQQSQPGQGAPSSSIAPSPRSESISSPILHTLNLQPHPHLFSNLLSSMCQSMGMGNRLYFQESRPSVVPLTTSTSTGASTVLSAATLTACDADTSFISAFLRPSFWYIITLNAGHGLAYAAAATITSREIFAFFLKLITTCSFFYAFCF